MIRQRFDIEEYGWKVAVYYAVDCYYTDEIIGRLYDIGCRGDDLETAYQEPVLRQTGHRTHLFQLQHKADGHGNRDHIVTRRVPELL